LNQRAVHAEVLNFDVSDVHAGEQRFDVLQGQVHHLANGAQRVVVRHEVIQTMLRKQALGEGIGSAPGLVVWGLQYRFVHNV
jgi:hypothetical protein